MHSRYRIGVSALALLIAAVGVGACSSSGGAASNSSAAQATAGASGSAGSASGSAGGASLQSLYQAAKAANQDTIVIYGPAVAELAPVFDTFSKQFPGITVEGVPVFGPTLTQRINQEFASGKHVADMLFTGNTSSVQYASEGKLVSYLPPTAKDVPSQYIGPNDSFVAAVLGPFGIAYNTNLVPQSEAPKSWSDLLDPKWKGKMVMEDPSHAGATSDVLTNLLASGAYTRDFITRLKAQQPALESTMSQAGTDTAAGKYSILAVEGLSFYQLLKGNGAPLGYSFPLASDNYLAANYAAIVQGAPHPIAAKLFETWIFTQPALAALAQTGTYSPVPGAPAPPGYPPLDQIKQLTPVPLSGIAQAFNSSLAYFSQVFGGP